MMIPLLETTVRMSILLALALLALRLLRSQSAALRHALLSIAVLLAAATPLITLIAPSLNWPIPAVVPAPLTEGITSASGPPAGLADTTPSHEARATAFWSTDRLVAVVWGVGAALGILTVIVGFFRLARIASRSTLMRNARWTKCLDEICAEYGIRRHVRLMRSRNRSILVTWGLVRPVILVPAGAGAWPGNRIRLVLRHELAHVRRMDWPVHLMAEMTRAVYWFNPILWIVCRRLRLESEYACDDAILTRGIAPEEYAAQLLDVARAVNQTERAWSATLAMARPSTVERRIRAMLNPGLNRRPVTRFALLATILISLTVAVPIAGLHSSAPASEIEQVPAMTAVPLRNAPAVWISSEEPASRPEPAPVAGNPAPQSPAARLAGVVKDSAGAVVAGAVVVVATSDGRTEAHSTTDSAGQFSFTGLPAGAYSLQVFATGFGASQTASLQLAAGGSLRQDVELDIGFVNRGGTPLGEGTITGQVMDTAGARIPGVAVSMAGPSLAQGTITRITNAAGEYRIQAVPAGFYHLSFSLPGFKTLDFERFEVKPRSIMVRHAYMNLAGLSEQVTVSSMRLSTEVPPTVEGGPQRPIRVGGSVSWATIIGRVDPVYPADARAAGIEGVVVVETLVRADGGVEIYKVVEGHPQLTPAVIEAVRQWRYEPILLNGAPTAGINTVTVNFKLPD